MGLPDQPGEGEVCEFHLADLRHSGELSLVVVYDEGGTGSCNSVAILDKSGEAIEDYDFGASTGFSFDSIQHINVDGHYELIVDEGLARGEMNHCTADWPLVYTWTGSNYGYSDVSSHYRKYYEQQLASLRNDIAKAEAQKAQAKSGTPIKICQPESSENRATMQLTPNGTHASADLGPNGSISMESCQTYSPPVPPPDSQGLDCDKAEAAKIERFLGIARDAGFANAIKWSESNDPGTRAFAADLLQDFHTPEATEYLRTLAHDSDSNVAFAAKEDLPFASGASQPNPTIRGVAVDIDSPLSP